MHVFLDKIQRYTTKPDRALFLARYQDTFIAFATIIDHSPAPVDSDETTVQLLKTYTCGIGLMVLPEFRHNGVASGLVRQQESWAELNNLEGNHRRSWSKNNNTDKGPIIITSLKKRLSYHILYHRVQSHRTKQEI